MGPFIVVVVKLLGFWCGFPYVVGILGVEFRCGRVYGGGVGCVVVVVKLLGFWCGSLDVVEFLGWIIYLLLYRRDHCCGKASEILKWAHLMW